MGLGFMPSVRSGVHYDLVKFTVNRLKRANMLVKGKSEKDYELSIISHLQASPKLSKNLITQVGEEEVDKIVNANLFGFNHRPDTTIGNDGTAIEIKVIKSGHAIRDILGQAVVYRMYYRFVILVFVDNTPNKQIVEKCCDKYSQENSLLHGLARSHKIYSVVGPCGKSKNIAFFS